MGEFFNNLNQISKEPTYQNEWQQSELNIPKYDQNYIHTENELIYIYNNNNQLLDQSNIQNYNIIYQNQTFCEGFQQISTQTVTVPSW